MRRGAIFMLILIALVAAAATTAIAVLVDWLPEQASKEREGIDFVFWFTTAICIGIFAVVAAVSIYAGVKFRVRPDDDSDGPPIHGHTGIEIVWTAIPAVLVTAIAIVSAIVLARNDRTEGTPLRVKVLAQQFAWSFEYANGKQSGDLVLPVNRSTKLELTAREVIHSFFVPEFGQKQDAVPGIITTLVITPTKVNKEGYRLICTELCGLGHALMRSRAIVLPAAEFDRWLSAGVAAGGGAGTEPEAKSLFVSNCGGCHTLDDAGTTGTIGPSLDDLQMDERAIENQIRRGGGGMPPFEDELDDEQIEELVRYLVAGSR